MRKKSEGDVKSSCVGVLDDESGQRFGDTEDADLREQWEWRYVVVRHGAEDELCEG